jgi:hypothetical protein
MIWLWFGAGNNGRKKARRSGLLGNAMGKLPLNDIATTNVLKLGEAKSRERFFHLTNQEFYSNFVGNSDFDVGYLHFDTPGEYLVEIKTEKICLCVYDAPRNPALKSTLHVCPLFMLSAGVT